MLFDRTIYNSITKVTCNDPVSNVTTKTNNSATTNTNSNNDKGIKYENL